MVLIDLPNTTPRRRRFKPITPAGIPLSLAMGQGMLTSLPVDDDDAVAAPSSRRGSLSRRSSLAPAPEPAEIAAAPASAPSSARQTLLMQGAAEAFQLPMLQKRLIAGKLTAAARPLRREAPKWWDPPPDVVANANAFDLRRLQLQRSARSALEHLDPAGGSVGAHHNPQECHRFDLSLRAVRLNRFVAPAAHGPDHRQPSPSGTRHQRRQEAPGAKGSSKAHTANLSRALRLAASVRRLKSSGTELETFDVRQSCWAPRAKWCDSRDLLDTLAIEGLRFEHDWTQLLTLDIHTLMRHDNGPADEATELREVSEALRSHHDFLFNLFSYYATIDGEISFLTPEVWLRFLHDCKLEGGVDGDLTWATKLFHSIDTMAPSLEYNRTGFFSRVEFLLALVTIAVTKYILTGVEVRTGKAVERLITYDVQMHSHPAALLDANTFRRTQIYTREVCDVLEPHVVTLRNIFLSLTDGCPSGGRKLIDLRMWLGLLRASRCIGPDLSEQTAVLCFSWSRMAVVEPRTVSGFKKENMLPFEGFLEALCRVAQHKALPTDEEIVAAHDTKRTQVRHAGSFLAYLEHVNAGAYAKLLRDRHTGWGEEPSRMPWQQPIDRRVEHTIAILVYEMKRQVDSAASAEADLAGHLHLTPAHAHRFLVANGLVKPRQFR